MSVSDLTGYTWVGNNIITFINEYSSVSFNLNYKSNFSGQDYTFSTFKFQYEENDEEQELHYINNQNDITAYVWYDMAGGGHNSWYPGQSGLATIEITGGTDATNSTLIAWLEANGTLTASSPTPTGNTYNLTHTLTNLTKGNITLQITPDTNYTYPTSLTISNGTIVSYNNTTGVAVISGDDTTIVNGECVAQASGYSVSVYSDINDDDIIVAVYDGQNNSGIYLGTLSSFQTGNYIITSGYIHVEKAPSPIMTPGIVYFDNTGGMNTLPISSDTSLTVISGPGPF